MKLEIDGLKETLDFQILLDEVRKLVQLESQIFINSSFEWASLSEEINKKVNRKVLPVHLGCYKNAYLFRLNSLFDTLSGDDTIEYVDALNYDIHSIILKCLENIIDNEYYQEIRADLLRFKYDIIFLDYNVESDFLLENDRENVILNSRNFKKELPSSKYVDQAILIHESLEDIRYLRALSIGFNENYYSLSVIYILHILSRIAMCDDELLVYIMDDFNHLLEDDEIHVDIKRFLQEMVEIFKQLQNEIHFKR